MLDITPELARDIERAELEQYEMYQWLEDHQELVAELVAQVRVPSHLVLFGREAYIWEFREKTFRRWKEQQKHGIEQRYQRRVIEYEVLCAERRRQAIDDLPRIQAEYGGPIEKVLNEIINRALSGRCGCNAQPVRL